MYIIHMHRVPHIVRRLSPTKAAYLFSAQASSRLARAYSHFHNVCATYNAENSYTNKRWGLISTRTQKPHQIQPYKYTYIHICIVYALMYYIFGTLNSLTTGTPLICRRRRTQNTNRQRDSAPAQLNARDIARLHIACFSVCVPPSLPRFGHAWRIWHGYGDIVQGRAQHENNTSPNFSMLQKLQS